MVLSPYRSLAFIGCGLLAALSAFYIRVAPLIAPARMFVGRLFQEAFSPYGADARRYVPDLWGRQRASEDEAKARARSFSSRIHERASDRRRRVSLVHVGAAIC